MSTIYFITGNSGKFREASEIIPNLKQLDIDLAEVQSLDTKQIIRSKLEEALKHYSGKFIVDDVSLSTTALGGLPGPFIKWFLQTLGADGIARLVHKHDDHSAEAKAMIGYANSKGEMYFFEGVIAGQIILPKGETSFCWDPIFKPYGHDKTFAEMSLEYKNKISHRGIALQKLREFLENNKYQ